MAGQYPQYSDPYRGQLSHPDQPFPAQTAPYPGQGFGYPPAPGAPPSGAYDPAGAAAVYPGTLPPPVPYPKRRRWRLVGGIVLVIALVGALTTSIIFAIRNEGAHAGYQLNAPSTKTAIQNYLNALSNGDTETVARNTLCGMYDQVRDRRSDLALARLSSEAFRKQFSKADVTSIDKIVFLSSKQAQVLFTMRVVPVTRAIQSPEEQAIAQVLAQDNHVLVCSYLLRTAAQF
jgi:hypothetical protein